MDLERIAARLAAEHRHDDSYLVGIKTCLRHLAAGQPLDNEPAIFERVGDSIQTQRLHFAYENATLLPLAGLRPTAQDKQRLGRSFAARCGAASVG